MSSERYESSSTKNRLGRFYTNDIIFTACVIAILGIAGFTLYQNLYNIYLDPSSGPYESAGTKIIIIISTLVLFIGYLRNNKNAMQGMMGALLSLLVIKSVPIAIMVFVQNRFTENPYYCLFVLAVTVGFLVLFVNHQMINRLYISSPGRVFFNEAVVAILSVGFIALFGYYLAQGVTFWKTCSTLASLGMYVLVADCVIFVEANIDYERLQREGE